MEESAICCGRMQYSLHKHLITIKMTNAGKNAVTVYCYVY